MKTCPLCGGEGKPEVDARQVSGWRWTCVPCGIAAPLQAWDALPRVAPNAEALVETFAEAEIELYDASRGSPHPSRMKVLNETRDTARAALLRACVVDAADVALAAKSDVVHVVRYSDNHTVDIFCTENGGRPRAPVGPGLHEPKPYALMDGTRYVFEVEDGVTCPACLVLLRVSRERDEAVAALAAVKNPAPFPSERFVATVIAMMPEWFNDADATDSFRALTKALRGAATDLPRDTPDVVIERATGVPEAELLAGPSTHWFSYDPANDGFTEHATEDGAKASAEEILDAYRDEAEDGWSEDVNNVCWGQINGVVVQTKREPDASGKFDEIADYGFLDTRARPPAAPPVAEDADALLNRLVLAARAEGTKAASRVVAARAAVRARMRPQVTAEVVLTDALRRIDFFATQVLSSSGLSDPRHTMLTTAQLIHDTALAALGVK